jgi:signal transduction histidine kinase
LKIMRLRLLCSRSIRARFTLTVGLLTLIILTVIGVIFDFTARNRVEAHIFDQTQRVAFNWLASMRPGQMLPQREPADNAYLLQIVDSHGRVVEANAPAAGRPPLSAKRPPVGNRFQYRVECPPHGRCVLVTAFRPIPLVAYAAWGGEPHYIYAGMEEPSILATHELEGGIAAAVLLASAIAAWITWVVVGRTLRPVAAISKKLREATVSDLSMRVPEPAGDDEIAELARTSNEYLEQLEEAVTYQRRFASIASHELRSPVAGLRVQLDEALTYPDDLDAQETLRTALRTTERFEAIINELLAYTRITKARTSPPEPIDLTPLVREEVSSRSHGAPIRLHATCEPTVRGIRIPLQGVLSNLLANAQRHAHSRVDVTVERVGDQAVVTVQDDGEGIAPEDRERVFEPFVRLAEGRRRDVGGSGLGLALCREAADLHNGSLAIEDSPRGARFVLRLPLMGLTPASGAETGEAAGAAGNLPVNAH